METKIKINHSERLKQVSHRTKGLLSEADIWTYAVIDASGNNVGSVIRTDHNFIKGLHCSQSVE